MMSESFSYIWPKMLLLLGLLPVFTGFYIFVQRRRKRYALRLSSFGIGKEALKHNPGMRRHIPALFFLVGLAILLIAMARPQAVVQLPKQEGTVVLVFDVSGSMAADDLKPTRMEAAKVVARDFILSQSAGVQIGVVAFSESGLAVLQPTNVQQEALAAIERLKPERGTSLAHGILAALDLIFGLDTENLADQNEPDLMPTSTPLPVPKGSYPSAVIVLFSDGENNAPPEPYAAAEVAADRGVRIHTIGIGSPTGAILNVDGFMVQTQLDEEMLQLIAETTAGFYHNASNEMELQEILKDLKPQLVLKEEKMEITSILAGASVLIFLIGSTISLIWFGRVF